MNDQEFAELVQKSTSIRQILSAMGLRQAGGNYLTIKRRIACLKLEVDHLLGQAHLRGKENTWHPETPLAEILVMDSVYKGSTYRLKKRLLAEGIFEAKCYGCGLTEWRGAPIPLELEHTNGRRTDIG